MASDFNFKKHISENRGEEEVCVYIKKLIGVDNVIENDKSVLDGKALDIYVPTKNIAIEYNNLLLHGEASGGKNRNYHLNKTNLCSNKGIRLIHIFEDEWINKKDIIKNKLKHILNVRLDDKAIFARKCEIKAIGDCKEFLNDTHIQGHCYAKIKLGAFYKDKLVGVMTFGGRRLAMGKKTSLIGEYELLRFATNCRVVGIASKLFSYFIKTYNATKIITYADKRYSIGNLYERMGFTKTKDSKPGYWYFKPGDLTRYHRFIFAKHRLYKRLSQFDPALTEWQNMQNNGYDRIWDCGNMRFEWNKI